MEGEMSLNEMNEAHSHLLSHVYSFLNSSSLKCALELGIPDVMSNHGKPMSLSQLSTALSIPASKTPHLRCLMSHLVHSKFFSEQEQDIFSLTTFSKILVKDQKSDVCSASPISLLLLDEKFVQPCFFLGKWFKIEDGNMPVVSPFEMLHGMPLFEATSKLTEFNKKFNEGMVSDASVIADLIIRNCSDVFKGLSSLVDVGGSTGTLACMIAKAFPKTKCIVLDMAHVVEGLEGSRENVQFVAGDMFDHIPKAQAAVLKWILHDWSDEECVTILNRCKEAIPCKEAGGKVIIIDMVVNPNNKDRNFFGTQLLANNYMVANTTGKERYENDWKKLFEDAGFKSYKILPITLGLRSVIEVYY